MIDNQIESMVTINGAEYEAIRAALDGQPAPGKEER